MSFAAYLTLAVVGLMLVGLVLELLAPDVIVFSALGMLLLCKVLTPREALAGFSNGGMLTVGILFIVAFAAQTSGILEFFAERVMGRSGGGRKPLLRMMAPVVAMSAFLNNTPIVAMFTPTIRDWALRNRLAPSKFLIPLSYAAIFGGLCTLIGTSTNLVVNGLLQQTLGRSLSMFELAWVGIPCAGAGVLFMLLVGHRLLPDNRDLDDEFRKSGREYLLELRVVDGSALIGKTVEGAGLRQLDQAYLTEIVRAGATIAPVRPGEALEGGTSCFSRGTPTGSCGCRPSPAWSLARRWTFLRQCRAVGGDGSSKRWSPAPRRCLARPCGKGTSAPVTTPRCWRFIATASASTDGSAIWFSSRGTRCCCSPATTSSSAGTRLAIFT